MVLDLVRFPLPQLDVPPGDVGVPPLARDVNVIRRHAIQAEVISRELLRQAVRSGAIEPGDDSPPPVDVVLFVQFATESEQFVHDRVRPLPHAFDGPAAGGGEVGVALEVDVARPAEGGHAQAHPHLVQFSRLSSRIHTFLPVQV